MKPEIEEFLNNISNKVEIALVGGSDMQKCKEQIGVKSNIKSV